MSNLRFDDEEEMPIIKKLGGHVFTSMDNKPEFVFNRYNLSVFVILEGECDYLCKVTRHEQEEKMPIMATAHGRHILEAIEYGMAAMQRALLPYILADAATKFIEDDINKEFPE